MSTDKGQNAKFAPGKLSKQAKAEILRRVAAGEKPYKIAPDYDVAPSAIYFFVRRARSATAAGER